MNRIKLIYLQQNRTETGNARWGRRPSAPWVPVVLPLPPLAATLHTKKRNQGKGLLFADTSTRS